MNNLLFSLITPTHGTPYLDELYESIIAQTYENWEWILYLNGDASQEMLSDVIKSDSRVKIFEDRSGNSNVGYLKNVAFHTGTGDVLVEVDHDDILTPDCLFELNEEFQNPDIGFVYSDDATYHMQNAFVPYSPYYGWTHGMYEWRDMQIHHMHSFDATSRSLAFIWYAPDHVRAWRSDVYRSIGGHNVDLSILDDQELMVRTYLVTKFAHIPKVLYVYRITGANTWLERNAAIQTGTVQLFHQYAQQLAERDADLNGLLKIDLGGGLNPRPGYMTIDIEGSDIIADLNNGIPLPDNSVGVINASHVLEHIRDPLKSMSEIHRVLVDGGWAFIDVPSTDGRGAWMDPTHVSYWNENSFLYYTKREQASYIRNDKIKFQSFRCETHFPNNWYREKQIPVVSAWLCAIKSNEKRPHPIDI